MAISDVNRCDDIADCIYFNLSGDIDSHARVVPDRRRKRNIAVVIDKRYRHGDTVGMDWIALIKRLNARGWLQTQIAERVGATQSTVSELLNGKTGEPRYSVAAALIALDESGEKPPQKASIPAEQGAA